MFIMYWFLLFIAAAGAAALISVIIHRILRSPFKYPYFYRWFDVSGRRNPKIDDYVDEYIIRFRMSQFDLHEKEVEKWKDESEQYLRKCHFPRYRRKQYEDALDEKNTYRFILTREQTRYQQRNYVRTPYKVTRNDSELSCNYDYLAARNEDLAAIGYETTLNKYNSREQRRLMTPELKKEIMVRDDYTCQICGKYMPDEVGLHIDHIIPISKGGKSVQSNLQVLCSKCNGRKRDKIVAD